MKTNREILRRTAAFITSVTFLSNYTGISLAAQEISVVSENSVTSSAEITENSVTVSEFSDSEKVTLSVSYTEKSYSTTLQSTSEQLVSSEIPVTTSAPAQKFGTSEIKIILNGSSVFDYSKLINELFMFVYPVKVNGNIVTVNMPLGNELDELLWEDRPEGTFFDFSESRLRLDSISGTEINLTEYYDISGLTPNGAEIIPETPISGTQGFYPHGTVMKIQPEKGWIAENSDMFRLSGNIYASMTGDKNKYSLKIMNGNENIICPMHKSRYGLMFPENENIESVFCGEKTSFSEFTWIDDTKINAEFYVKEDADVKILKVTMKNQYSGDQIDFYPDTDGKSIICSIDTLFMDDIYKDTVIYSFDVETVSDTISLNAYCTEDNKDRSIGKIKYNTKYNDGKCCIEAEPIIYENGVARYIIDAYQYGKDAKKFLNITELYEEKSILDPVFIEYKEDVKIYYKPIIQDYNHEIKVLSICEEVDKTKKIYSFGKIAFGDLFTIEEIDNIEYDIIYSILYNSGYDINEYNNNSKFQYFHSDVSNNGKYIPSSINIKSILYLKDNELHNVLTSPMYFYIDDYSPKISLTNKNNTAIDNSYWSDMVYNFTIKADDHEKFSQISGDPKAEEINSIYDTIDNISSEITGLSIGDYSFEKKNDKWELSEKIGSSPEYSVKVSQLSEGTYNVVVELGEDEDGKPLRGFEKDLDVTASDKYGNISNSEKISVKIDKEAPTVSNISVKNASSWIGNNLINTGGCNLEVLVSAYDNISDIRSLSIEYGDFKDIYFMADGISNHGIKCEKLEDEMLFMIPVSTNKNIKSKLKITVTDNAGNKGVYYYKRNGSPEVSYENADTVIIDIVPPECSISKTTVPAYTSPNEKKWYSIYPEINISATDEKSLICSNIDIFSVSINGSEEKKIEFLNAPKIENYKLTFTPDETDKHKCVADINFGIGRNYSLGEYDISETNGKISVCAYVIDTAGNSSNKVFYEFYMDVDEPEAEDIFKIAEDNDSLRNFGSFFNKGITLKAGVSEGENASSGLSKAVLEFGGEIFVHKFDGEKKSTDAEFFIPFDTAEKLSKSGEAVISVYDNAGNVSEGKTLVSDKNSPVLVIENISPEISFLLMDEKVKYTDADNNVWYNKNIDISYTISDADKLSKINSGIKTANISVNGKTLVNENYKELPEKTQNKKYTVNTSTANESDGRFVFSVTAEDNAGNINTAETTVFTDITAPEITAFSIGGIYTPYESFANGILTLPFGYFFAGDTEVIVFAEDKNASSGLDTIYFTLYNADSSIFKEMSVSGDSIEYSDGIYSVVFTVPEGFKGTISSYAADNVSNKSEERSPKGFILENNGRHLQTSSADIKLPETEYTDINGLPLYADDVDIILSAIDSFSGINKVEWGISDHGENAWRSVFADNDGKINGDETASWKINGTERNLVTNISGDISSSLNSNENTVRFKMTDNAGNTSSTQKMFSIDKSEPVIDVIYDDSTPDSVYTNIYKTSRTAAVRIREQNFDSSKVNIVIDGNMSGVSQGEWTLAEGKAGTDSAVYQSKIVFSGNGQYKLTVDCTDMCENKAVQYVSENFIIDRTAPVLEVVSDIESENGRYFSSKRTITVNITDDNFDAGRVNILRTADGIEETAPEISEWKSSGSVHTLKLTFDKDAEYTLSIKGSDKAGNAFSPYIEKFCIDTEYPQIKFGGVSDKSANKGEVSCSVSVSDENLDKSSVKFKLNGAKRGEISLENAVFNEDEKSVSFEYNNFPKEKEYDDIYTLTVSAKDSAGNSTEKSIMFSVNRFGSSYIFEEDAIKIANTYIKKPVDIVIHEINADVLKEGQTEIKIVKDSENITLSEGTDYKVSCTGGNGQWYDYEYVIYAKNFSDDAAYMVMLYSTDKAGNQNSSADSTKSAELKFGIDKTDPRCVPVNIESNGSYKADTLEVKLVVTDNILLDNVKVYLNGNSESEEVNADGKNFSFMMSSSGKPQLVKILSTDMAGNENETIVENVLISPSLARVMIHKTWVKATGVCAVAGGTAGGIFLFRRRRLK